MPFREFSGSASGSPALVLVEVLVLLRSRLTKSKPDPASNAFMKSSSPGDHVASGAILARLRKSQYIIHGGHNMDGNGGGGRCSEFDPIQRANDEPTENTSSESTEKVSTSTAKRASPRQIPKQYLAVIRRR